MGSAWERKQSWPEWPDLLFLKGLGDKIFMQKEPKYLVTFWAILKSIPVSVETLVASFLASLEKNGQLFIPPSGHTDRDLAKIFKIAYLVLHRRAFFANYIGCSLIGVNLIVIKHIA